MPLRSRARWSAAAAALLTFTAAAADAQSRGDKRKLEESQRAEAQELVGLVEKAATGESSSTGLTLRWGQHHFIKAQGEKTYVPFTIAIESETPVNPAVGLYLRVVAAGAAQAEGTAATPADSKAPTPEYAFEDLFFFDLPGAPAGQPRRVSRAFAVAPGTYDVYLALRERAASAGPQPPPLKSGVLKQSVTVPDFNTPGLMTSTVIVAQRIDMLEQPVDPELQAEHPFTFGQMQIVPAPELQFSKKDELTIVFWIYGAESDPATKKPNVHIEYKFHQVSGDTEKYFNKTEPQLLNAETLPPQFDLALGHQLSGSLAVGLTSFPEGTYRLEIEVSDKVAGKQVTPDVKFTVAP